MPFFEQNGSIGACIPLSPRELELGTLLDSGRCVLFSLTQFPWLAGCSLSIQLQGICAHRSSPFWAVCKNHLHSLMTSSAVFVWDSLVDPTPTSNPLYSWGWSGTPDPFASSSLMLGLPDKTQGLMHSGQAQYRLTYILRTYLLFAAFLFFKVVIIHTIRFHFNA